MNDLPIRRGTQENDRLAKLAKPLEQTLSELPSSTGSVIPERAAVIMEAEGVLMKAANDFAHQWGRDQTVHPKMYWLELHLSNWRSLAEAAIKYSSALESQNID